MPSKEFEEYIKDLEERRDFWKALAEDTKELFPKMAKALAEKHDKILLKIFEEDRIISR